MLQKLRETVVLGSEHATGLTSQATRLGKHGLHKVHNVVDNHASMKAAYEKRVGCLDVDDGSGRPNWMRYVDVKPLEYLERAYLGGDETAGGMFSFVYDMFYFKGTVTRRVVIPCAASSLVTMCCCLGGVGEWNTHLGLFVCLFMVTLFVLGFRIFGAWHSYRRGHEMLVTIGSKAVDVLITCCTCIHVRNSGLDMLEMIRRLNVLMAFIRQDLRESRQHVFDAVSLKAGSKKGRLVKEAFNTEDSLFDDPYGSPPLRILLSEAESAVYKPYGTQDRVLVCTISIRTLFSKYVHFGANKMSTPDTKILQNNLESIIHCWGKCREIMKTPPPFVMHHLCLVLLFMLCIILSPFYFVAELDGWALPWFSTTVLTYAMYGLEEASCEMEVPFGWRRSDGDLTKMCRTFLKRSATFSKVCKIVKETTPPS